MKPTIDVRSRIQTLFERQSLAVLATWGEDQPYTSLVGFVATPDLDALLFVTAQTTRKYANLTAHPQVSLLIDSRSNREADFHHAIAVTALGSARPVSKAEHPDLLARYLARHAYLESFVQAPTTDLVQVTVARYYLVQQFQNVMELRMTP
jgi:nitroimidazol reductase NimA-like FMN-containing flavoprotein (pyridoxamine 5'-phosphate oxidase superfamily)